LVKYRTTDCQLGAGQIRQAPSLESLPELPSTKQIFGKPNALPCAKLLLADRLLLILIFSQ
jgi:hypothetical protein